MTAWGVHRRKFAEAKRSATWLTDADAAAVRAAEDLADRLDQLRRLTLAMEKQPTLFDSEGEPVGAESSIVHWRASSVHARFQSALEQLRMTPSTRPDGGDDDDDEDLIGNLRAAMPD